MIECSRSDKPKYKITQNPSGWFSVYKREPLSWWGGGSGWKFIDTFLFEGEAERYIAKALERKTAPRYFKEKAYL